MKAEIGISMGSMDISADSAEEVYEIMAKSSPPVEFPNPFVGIYATESIGLSVVMLPSPFVGLEAESSEDCKALL